MKCNNKNHLKWIYEIIAAQSLAYGYGIKYTGRKFKYCPFCGKEKSDKVYIPPDNEKIAVKFGGVW